MNVHVPPPARPAPDPVTAKRFTWDEVVAMGEAGLFAETDRVELIEGEIFVMPPEGPEHANAVHDLTRWLRRALPDSFEIFQRAPVLLSDSVVVPDLSVFPAGARAEQMTGGACALIVEASFSTQRHDFATKSPRYAAAGAPELWILDLAQRTLWAHREPSGEGWNWVRTLRVGEALAPLCAPQTEWVVAFAEA